MDQLILGQLKKKQQFDQFGIETLGTKILAADVEIVENP